MANLTLKLNAKRYNILASHLNKHKQY